MENLEKIFIDVEGVAAKARPFSIMAKPNNDTLIIMVHGYSGSPYDIWALAENLAASGFDIEAPLLAGHGGNYELLAGTGEQDWIASVEKVLLKNADKYNKIFLIGFSFGVNICLQLALKYPQTVTGIISLGVFIYKRKEWMSRLILPFTKFFPNAKYTKDWLTEEEKKLYPEIGRHTVLPVRGVNQVAHFIDNFTKKEINKVKTPILIIHSRDDKVSHPRGSEYLYNHLGSSDKNLFILNKPEHNPVWDELQNYVFTKIFSFIKTH